MSTVLNDFCYVEVLILNIRQHYRMKIIDLFLLNAHHLHYTSSRVAWIMVDFAGNFTILATKIGFQK